MASEPQNPVSAALERFSQKVTEWVGSSWAFTVAVAVILAWGITGPVFHFSDTWQLVINTGTTIVTFLMVFLIQRAQNKEARAMQLKLNELVASIKGASNRLVDVEDLSEDELRTLQKHYQDLAEHLKEKGEPQAAHSVEEMAKKELEPEVERKTRAS